MGSSGGKEFRKVGEATMLLRDSVRELTDLILCSALSSALWNSYENAIFLFLPRC